MDKKTDPECPFEKDPYEKLLDTSETEKLLFGVKEALSKYDARPPDGAGGASRVDQLRADREFEHIQNMKSERVWREKQFELDQGLKKNYAKWFFWVLIAQLAVMNIAFIGVGFGFLKFDQWKLELYLSGTLFEVFAGVFVIIKSLFPNKTSK